MKRLLLLSLTAITAHAAQAPVKQPKDTIKLILDDKHTYVVPRNMAMQAESIRAVVEGMGIANNIPIYKQVDAKNMALIAQIMWSFYHHEGKHGKAILDAVEKEVGKDTFRNPYTLLKAMNYLGFKPGVDLVARTIAANAGLAARMQDELKGLQGLKPIIARYYYLLHRQDLPGVDANSYGFSVQDYLDYQPQRIAQRHTDNRLGLDLSNLRLTSLEGLQNIQGLAQLQRLYLNNNQISQLTPNVFTGLGNLQRLYLNDNQLSQLAPNQFAGLVQLHGLYLNNNQLAQLAPNQFTGLANLQLLYLNNNQLTQLAPNQFAGLSQLQHLYLSNNQITQLAPNQFAGLGNLRGISLNNNQLSQLAPDQFTGLAQLQWLNISHNQLSQDNKKQIADAVHVIAPDVNILL